MSQGKICLCMDKLFYPFYASSEQMIMNDKFDLSISLWPYSFIYLVANRFWHLEGGSLSLTTLRKLMELSNFKL